MKKKVVTLIGLIFIVIVKVPSGLAADSPATSSKIHPNISAGEQEHERIHSMGLPSRWEFYLAPMMTIDRDGSGTNGGGQLTGGIYRHLANPNLGLGLAAEGYLGAVESEADTGLRLLGVIKFPFLQAGIDHSFRIHETDFILSLVFPVKRGGLFGIGDRFRIDWLPGSGNRTGPGQCTQCRISPNVQGSRAIYAAGYYRK